jgi:uncharacterized Zn ribbon protein
MHDDEQDDLVRCDICTASGVAYNEDGEFLCEECLFEASIETAHEDMGDDDDGDVYGDID